MDSPLNTSPSPEPILKFQATPLPKPKLSEVVASEPGERRLPRLGPGRHEPEQLPCPRCNSTNTKFCYYNNYNLSQPRHFCKSCRRYWTRGGALRNVPVGGATRKATSTNKRRRIGTTTPPATATATATNCSSNNLVSCSSDIDLIGQNRAFEVVVSDPVPGPCSSSTQVEKSGSSSWWWNTSAETGLLHSNGYDIGLGLVVGYEHGVLDWPGPEQVSGGNDEGAVVSAGCSTWQMGGDVNIQGGDAVADYFSWPELGVSTPAKALNLN